MSPKRAPPKAPTASSTNAAKKASRPAATKKKQAAAKPAAVAKVLSAVTKHLNALLYDKAADAQSIVSYIVGQTCGLESKHVRSSNATSLLLAVQANRPDVVRLLLEEHSPNITAAADCGRAALHFAALHDQSHEMVSHLVEVGVVVDAVDKGGNTPLHDAILWGNSNVAKLLLELGANPIIANNRQQTPLHTACESSLINRGGRIDATGLIDVSRALLAKGAPIDATDHNGETPLLSAIYQGHGDLGLLLLELGANPRTANKWQRTPLHNASWKGLADVAKALVAKGASVDAVDATGCTSIYYAVHERNSSMALMLLELGANPNICDNEQKSPLHVACQKGLVDVASSLVARGGISIDAADSRGDTPLLYAIVGEYSDLALLLLEHGADPSVANNEHRTPLHAAVERGLVDVTKALLAKGVVIDVMDANTNTPLSYANRSKSQ